MNISTAEDPIEYDLPGVTQIQANSADRPHVRRDPARVPAPGSRRAARRRDARQGNRAYGGRGGADGASRLHHAPHQQRGGGVHAPGRDGRSSRSSCRRRRSGSSRSGWRGGLCQACKEPYDAGRRRSRRFLGLPAGRHALSAAAAARACGGKGVQGRVGIYEVMKVSPRIRTMVGRGALRRDPRGSASKRGWST